MEKTKTVADILVEARKLIEKRTGWTKRFSATTIDGHPVSVFDPEAKCFCADGAVLKAANSSSRPYMGAHEALSNACGGSVVDFNDDPRRTHKQVLAAFDKAISSARQGGAS